MIRRIRLNREKPLPNDHEKERQGNKPIIIVTDKIYLS